MAKLMSFMTYSASLTKAKAFRKLPWTACRFLYITCPFSLAPALYSGPELPSQDLEVTVGNCQIVNSRLPALCYPQYKSSLPQEKNCTIHCPASFHPECLVDFAEISAQVRQIEHPSIPLTLSVSVSHEWVSDVKSVSIQGSVNAAIGRKF